MCVCVCACACVRVCILELVLKLDIIYNRALNIFLQNYNTNNGSSLIETAATIYNCTRVECLSFFIKVCSSVKYVLKQSAHAMSDFLCQFVRCLMWSAG